MYTIDTYAVFGNPINHSKSPQIHTAFAQQTQQQLTYLALLAEIGEFPAAIDAFQAQGGKGCNITVPFKQDAFDLADQLTERAQQAGAVNTLWFDEQGKRIGDNTDGVGLVRDLTQNHQVDLQAKRILILGAGGAVRGVLAPLLEQQPASLLIANRTVEKAEALAKLYPGQVAACAYDKLEGQQFDVIINGTSAGLQGQIPPLPEKVLSEGGIAYDMLYASEPTAFVRWSQEQGRTGIDGLGMLVEQAAEAFYVWRGVRPETQAVIAELC